MQQVLHIFLFFMISLGQAREDHLPEGDGTFASRQDSRQLRAYDDVSGKLNSKYEVSAEELKYLYIDPKCCNFSTTAVCSRFGSDGFKGFCMPRNETCLGREFFGSKYCVISKHQSCKCCVPSDCERQTLSPCAELNGTCVGLNDPCNGTSVISNEFCKRDSIKDTCKCCFPLVPPRDHECPCGQDYDGICVGSFPDEHHQAGHKNIKGRCMKTCDRGHTSLADHTCNTTGGNDCKCCDLEDYCGDTCHSPSPLTCMCMTNGQPCPKGMCSHPDGDICPHDGCTCCRDKLIDYCTSKEDQCIWPDYCVEKFSGDCPNGYSKVYNACTGKGFKGSVRAAANKQNNTKVYDCDCCKKTECVSIGDRCTGRGSFCTDYGEKCPTGYSHSLECSRQMVLNGTFVGEWKCGCCKPISIECFDGCFQVGSQCFRTHPQVADSWEKASEICSGYPDPFSSLAEPQDPQALSQYLATNYDDATYWIGAHGTDNGNAAWVSGGVIGPNAPWFSNSYGWCTTWQWCMYLQANSGCYASDQCLGCEKCYASGGVFIGRKPLCSCGII